MTVRFEIYVSLSGVFWCNAMAGDILIATTCGTSAEHAINEMMESREFRNILHRSYNLTSAQV